MMKNKWNRLLLIAGMALLNGCGWQVNCPKFDHRVLDWIPYEKQDTLRLVNATTDSTLTFVIESTTIDHKTEYNTLAKCGKCDDFINIYSPDSLWIHISLNENRITLYRYSIMGVHFADDNSEYSEEQDYEFGHEVYEQVRIFEKKDSDEKFVKLILAKGYGIVGLVDRNGNSWILKNTHPKVIQPGAIEMNNTPCG